MYLSTISGGRHYVVRLSVRPSVNSFGNRTSPSDNSNDRWKRLCLISWAAAPCVLTLRARTRNVLLTYLTAISCDTISLYLMKWFQWNLPQTFFMWIGIAEQVFEVKGRIRARQRAPSAVYKCVNAITAMWRRGSPVFLVHFRLQLCKNHWDRSKFHRLTAKYRLILFYIKTQPKCSFCFCFWVLDHSVHFLCTVISHQQLLSDTVHRCWNYGATVSVSERVSSPAHLQRLCRSRFDRHWPLSVVPFAIKPPRSVR